MSAFRETGLHQLWITCGKASTGDGFLSMNCASPLGHIRAGAFTPSPITGFDVASTFCDNVCDEITDVFHKLGQFSSTVIDDDMEILCRFVSECMTGPAQLRKRWCKTGDVRKELSPDGHQQYSSQTCRLGMDEEDSIWQIFWRDLPLLRRDASSWLNVAANRMSWVV